MLSLPGFPGTPGMPGIPGDPQVPYEKQVSRKTKMNKSVVLQVYISIERTHQQLMILNRPVQRTVQK